MVHSDLLPVSPLQFPPAHPIKAPPAQNNTTFFQLFLLVLVLYLVQVHLEIGLLVVQLRQSYVGKLFFKTNLSNEGHQGKSITPKQNSCCICKLVFGVYMKNKLHNGKDQITLT